MPKCYSEQERAYITRRLKEEAASCMALYGIRRTTVDELVRRVKIPKGTFYLFYPSKELLLFDVIMEQHDQMEQKLFQLLGNIETAGITVGQLTDILFNLFKMAEEMPILKMLDSGEIEVLARKLPPEVLKDHFGHDDSMVEKVLSALAVKSGKPVEGFSAAFRAVFLISLQKEKIGEKDYDEALRILLKGLVIQLLS